MKNGMKYLEKIDYQMKEKNFIKKGKNMQKEVLQIQNKIMDIDMLCIKVLKKSTLYMAYLCCSKYEKYSNKK